MHISTSRKKARLNRTASIASNHLDYSQRKTEYNTISLILIASINKLHPSSILSTPSFRGSRRAVSEVEVTVGALWNLGDLATCSQENKHSAHKLRSLEMTYGQQRGLGTELGKPAEHQTCSGRRGIWKGRISQGRRFSDHITHVVCALTGGFA